MTKRKLIRIDMPARPEKAFAAIEDKLQQLAARALLHVKQRILARLGHAATLKAAFAKADDDPPPEEALRAFLDEIKDEDFEWSNDIRVELRALLQEVADDRVGASLDSLGDYLGDEEYAAALTQANEASAEWARERVGNLVTGVSDTTRDAINEMTASAIENGFSNEQLARDLDDAWEFGAARSMLIARTETAFAESAGTLAGYRAAGIEGKGWSGEDPCDECAANVDDGIIPLDDVFSSGDDAPPAHPACRCSLYGGVLESGDEE